MQVRKNLICAMVLLLTVGTMVLLSVAVWQKLESEKNLRDANSAVDERIAELLSRTEYIEADALQKKELANNLMEHLYAERLIAHYRFHSGSQVFSFSYLDGSLGGITLREFHHSAQEGEPMN